MSQENRANITRRMFLRGSVTLLVAAGTTSFAPRVEDETPASILEVLGPCEALAGTIVSDTLPVVGQDEVGFVVKDVSNDNAPVEDAQIVVTSLYDKDKNPNDPKTATGTTDENGKAIINIKELSILDEKENPLNGAYQCIAEVQITTPGSREPMRNYSTAKALLEGASGTEIIMHALNAEDKDGDYSVYIERLTIDGWDIHYCTGTFLRGPNNDGDHTLCCRIYGIEESVKVTLDFLDADNPNDVARTAMKATCEKNAESGLYEANFSGHFLSTAGKYKNEVIEKDNVLLRFSFDYKGKHYESDKTIQLVDEPLESLKYKTPMSLLPANLNEIFEFSLHRDSGLPVFTGFKVQLVDFNFPFTVNVTPATVFFGFGHDFEMVDEQGKLSAVAWKSYSLTKLVPRLKEKRQQMRDAMTQMYANQKKPFLDKNGQATNKKILGKFNFDIIFHGVVGYVWTGFDGDPKLLRRKWEVEYQIYGGVSIGGSVTKQFVIDVVPVYITLSASAELVFGYSGAYDKVIAGENPTLDMSTEVLLPKHSFALDPSLMLSVSAGVGVAGALSAGISATVAFNWHIGIHEDPNSMKEDPHVTLDIIIRLEVCFQFFGLKVSAIIWDFRKNPIVNNWDKYGIEEETLSGMAVFKNIEPRFALTDANGQKYINTLPQNDGFISFNDLMDNAVLVSNDEMAYSHEATGTKRPKTDPLEQGVLPTLHPNMAPAFVPRDDGGFDVELHPCTSITVNTFDFGTSSQGGTTSEDTAHSTNVDIESVPSDEQDIEYAPLDDQDIELATVVATSVEADALVDDTNDIESDDIVQVSNNDVTEDFYLGVGARSGIEYDYTYEPGKTTGAPCPPAAEAFAKKIAEQNAANAAGGPGTDDTIIAAHDGVVPAVDVVIYQQVFSDTRQRIVVIDKIPHMFRIITVTYPGNVRRTRVAASKFDLTTRKWSQPTVIEFMSNSNKPSRLDMFDYDFDVAVRTGDNPWADNTDICLVITGGTRPGDDDTSMYEVFANATLSVVLLDKDLNAHQQSVLSVSDLYKDDKYHMIMCPRITDGFSPKGISGVLGFTFLSRTASNLNNLMSSDENLVSATFGFGYYHLLDSLMTPHVTVDCPDLSVTASSVEVVAGGDSTNSVMQILVTRSDGYDLFSAIIKANETIDNLIIRHNIHSNDSIAEVQPWPLKGSFLYTFDRPVDGDDTNYHLYEGTFDIDEQLASGFTPVQVDANGIKGAAFTVSPTGEYLFYFDSYRGDATLPPAPVQVDPSTDDEKNSDGMHNITNNDPTQDINRIMASRYVDGKFSEDFSFCELDYAADHIRCMQILPKETIFIINEINEFNHSMSQIHYVGVPNLMVAEVESFSSVEPFLYSGKTCELSVDVRSHGNMIIDGFTLQLLDAENSYQLVGEPFVVNKIDPSNIMLTASSTDWTDSTESDDGLKLQLSESEQQGKLMPGKTMTYKAEFDIPSEWEMKRELGLTLVDAWGPKIQLDDVEAEGIVAEAAEEDSLDDGVLKYFHSGAVGTVRLYDKEISSQSDDPEERVTPIQSESATGQDTSSGGATSASKATKVPNTGDSTSVAGPLGLAAAGLGAAFAAYSARRSRIENEEE